MSKTTLPEIYHELMKAPSIRTPYCRVCGRPANNQHHLVWRSWGELFDEHGHKMKKPTITLCGSGTTGCHGLAHQRRLHFRCVQKHVLADKALGMFCYSAYIEYLITDVPTKYQDALAMKGWKRLPNFEEVFCA